MKLDLIENFVGQDVDIKKLRPSGSYDFLINNRNGNLQKILDDIPLLNSLTTLRSCPACQCDDFIHVLKKDNLDIVKCCSCSTIYVNPIFDDSKYKDIYNDKHYNKVIQKHSIKSHLYRYERFGKERVKIFEKFYNTELPKRYLDIGCASGFTVECAKDNNWIAEGVELTKSSVEFARNLGLKIYSKPLEEIEFSEQYSVISLFDVLEHLVSPMDTLKQVFDLLHPSGIVVIYVPNWNSASRKLLGEENAHFIWPSHHLTYFTPQTLSDFVIRAGFDVIHWETQGLDLLDFQWYLNSKNVDNKWIDSFGDLLQFYINSSGHGKNLRLVAKKPLK
tara:strand:+ start:1275 stop:2276 length:1002 start_codon:yes stop_codon:yes gene_type:complete